MNPPLLQVSGLDAWYGGARILNGVGFTVAAGSVVALLGRNGAGKTTCLRAVFGLVPRRQGQIHFAGHDLMTLAPHQISRLGLGYVPEDRRLFADLTVLENLEVGRRLPVAGQDVRTSDIWTVERLFALFPHLAVRRHGRAGLLSGGEQQMLAVARALMANPRVLMLDEPAEGLAPRLVASLAEAIHHLRNAGVGVLLAEQGLALPAMVAEHVIVIETGVIRHQSTMGEILADDQARLRWLGLGSEAG